MTIHTLSRRLVLASLFGLLAASALFLSFPQIDLWVSRAFADPLVGGFPISHQPLWQDLRAFFILTTDGTVLLLLGLLIHNMFRPCCTIGSARAQAFVVAAYILGPGLVANGIFKSFWGRARPRSIAEFGAQLQFSPPVLPADQCSSNCSFVSGEASSAATVALAVIMLLWPRLGPRGRSAASMGALIYVMTASGLRVAFGGHFLSDTVFAVLMMGALVPFVHWAMIARKGREAREFRPAPKGHEILSKYG